MENNLKFDFDLLNNFPDMCLLLEGDGNIIMFNSAAAQKLLLNNAFNYNFYDFVDPAYREGLINFLSAQNSRKSEDSYFVKLNWRQKNIEVNLFVSKYQNEKITDAQKYNFIVARDITEDRKKERDLLRFYYVSENTVNPLQITDIQGRMVYVNPAFVEASGYSKEEIIGNNPNLFGSGKHSKKFWMKMWQTITSGKVWVGEVENRKKNGEPFYTQLLISPIMDGEGNVTGFFGVHRDLSEKKMLEKQLIHTQKMESIGTLAAGVAHEVGNPLASISALVQVVQRSTDDLFVKEKLELVKSQVTRISKIIRDLVDFSRPSNYELRLTDINENISEAVEIVKVGTKAKDIFYKLKLSDNIPLLPLVADQIQQVFVNILLNAVDAIMEMPDKKDNYIDVSSKANEDDIILTFSDTGPGIPEENQSKIFEPFYTTKKEGKGTGLGLWVSYGIIKSFQGDIKVKSKIGKGTIFTITLPIQT